MIYSGRLSSPNLHPIPLISPGCCWKSAVASREAYPALHFTLVKCQFPFLLPLTAYSSHHSLTINICVIQTRRWVGYRSCEGLTATHLSRDKDDQWEYYLKCLLVISTSSGLYWVLLNWGDADCHQTLGAFTIRWQCKALSVLSKKSTDLLFTQRGQERSSLPSAKFCHHPYLDA